MTILVIAWTIVSCIITGNRWPLRNILSDLGSFSEVGNKLYLARSKKAVSRFTVNGEDLARSFPSTWWHMCHNGSWSSLPIISSQFRIFASWISRCNIPIVSLYTLYNCFSSLSFCGRVGYSAALLAGRSQVPYLQCVPGNIILFIQTGKEYGCVTDVCNCQTKLFIFPVNNLN